MVTHITSPSNEKIKQIAAWQKSAKDRMADNIFIVEGLKMYHEAPDELIKEVYVTEKNVSECGDDIENCYIVTDAIMDKISDTKSPQGILTVLSRPQITLDDVLQGIPLLMVIENLQDPGNLGTILRMGEAAGVTGVIISKDSVDVFNPKVVRATMGSIYRMPFVVVDDIKTTVNTFKEKGITVYAAHLYGSEIYTDYDYKKPTAFLIGNEGNGLTDELTELADKRLFIPMEGKVESLNAGIAASILAYEAHRQRSMK